MSHNLTHASVSFRFSVQRPWFVTMGIRVLVVGLSLAAAAVTSPVEKYHLPHSKAYHRHAYPVIFHNVCSVTPNPLGADGSVLIRRFSDQRRPIALFCRHHEFSLNACNEIVAFVETEITQRPDEYNWMLTYEETDGLRVGGSSVSPGTLGFLVNLVMIVAVGRGNAARFHVRGGKLGRDAGAKPKTLAVLCSEILHGVWVHDIPV
jgi:hypothetical protein